MKFADNFSAAARGADESVLEVVSEVGKGRSFVAQDKAYCGTARHFCEFVNDLAAFSHRRES